MVVVGIFAGPMYDLGYLRSLVGGGGALAVAGFVAAGSATTFAETLSSLGFCVGLGAGCFYTPSLAHVTNCFEERRSLALGIAASGGSVGMHSPYRPLGHIHDRLTADWKVAWSFRSCFGA